MRAHYLASLLILPLLLAGCDQPPSDLVIDPEEAESEAEAQELLPQPLPLEDSPTAYGMLRVANELGFDDLDTEVGLDRRAVESIIAFRAGEDGYVGTSDDRYLDRVATLDALHWLGEVNLWAIQRYALLEGFVVDELPVAACPSALAQSIDQCLDFTELVAGGAATMDQLVPSCLEMSEPVCPSSEFFAASGVTAYEDPMLGYFTLLCEGDAPDESCPLGVAGMAAHLQPHCDELYDQG